MLKGKAYYSAAEITHNLWPPVLYIGPAVRHADIPSLQSVAHSYCLFLVLLRRGGWVGLSALLKTACTGLDKHWTDRSRTLWSVHLLFIVTEALGHRLNLNTVYIAHIALHNVSYVCERCLCFSVIALSAPVGSSMSPTAQASSPVSCSHSSLAAGDPVPHPLAAASNAPAGCCSANHCTAWTMLHTTHVVTCTSPLRSPTSSSLPRAGSGICGFLLE